MRTFTETQPPYKEMKIIGSIEPKVEINSEACKMFLPHLNETQRNDVKNAIIDLQIWSLENKLSNPFPEYNFD